MTTTAPRAATRRLLALATLLVASLLAGACTKAAPPPETAVDVDKLGAPAVTTQANAGPGDADLDAVKGTVGSTTGAAADKLLVPIYFGFDSYSLDESARQEVTELGRYLRDQQPDLALTIEGHADERGSVEYNLALGEQRARVTRTALVRLGVDAARLRTLSLGEASPAVEGHGESAFAKNRRAEFVAQ